MDCRRGDRRQGDARHRRQWREAGSSLLNRELINAGADWWNLQLPWRFCQRACQNVHNHRLARLVEGGQIRRSNSPQPAWSLERYACKGRTVGGDEPPMGDLAAEPIDETE